ncbi:Attractin-like protein 1 [Fukomys damarensis]|uniref:Attractin-like protein 1 n=1 Tax=Fukomys damarensis TaxID=885580 RepID=A0A091DD13_FUKDA|nr:Attractin-like protein 1 [Fukomys damarensis]
MAPKVQSKHAGKKKVKSGNEGDKNVKRNNEGLAIASALTDISQQKPSDNKDKTSGIRNRKHLSTRQGTCV